jgi:hypothetical protein
VLEQGQVNESPQTRSVVILDPSHAPVARRLAAAHGVEVEQVPCRGIEPVTTVTLVLVGTAAAVGAVLRRGLRNNGTKSSGRAECGCIDAGQCACRGCARR